MCVVILATTGLVLGQLTSIVCIKCDNVDQPHITENKSYPALFETLSYVTASASVIRINLSGTTLQSPDGFSFL
jgi:hypothetical protein